MESLRWIPWLTLKRNKRKCVFVCWNVTEWENLAGCRGKVMKTRGTLCGGERCRRLMMCGRRVMFDAHSHAWMKTGNLLASLAPLSLQSFSISLYCLSLLAPFDCYSVNYQAFVTCIHSRHRRTWMTVYCVCLAQSVWWHNSLVSLFLASGTYFVWYSPLWQFILCGWIWCWDLPHGYFSALKLVFYWW